VSVGTGFLLHASIGSQKSLMFLATNKHVVEGATSLTLSFIARRPDVDLPALGLGVDVLIDNPTGIWVGHPDGEIDVALIHVGGIINALMGKIYYRSIPSTQMPSEGDGVYIDAVEEITFVGYPDGRQDPAHLTPIVRRGTTATPLELPFGGKPTFLIDGSVFGGSSGSPVFLMNNGMYRTGPREVAPGNRLVLVGIIAATHVRENLWPVFVGTGPHVRIAQELNLGVVYNWTAINETIEAFKQNPPNSSPAARSMPPH
jgi:hypothetical protein